MLSVLKTSLLRQFLENEVKNTIDSTLKTVSPLVVGYHLINYPECFKHYKDNRITILIK